MVEKKSHSMKSIKVIGLVLSVLTEAGDRLNVVHKTINKNQFGICHPLPLHRTRVSRTLASIGEEIVGLKIKFFQEPNFVTALIFYFVLLEWE